MDLRLLPAARGHRGHARAGFTTLPVAAWLTGTLEMFTEIAGSVADWATGLVLNPITWAGIGLAGFGVVLIVISGYLRDRQLGRARTATGRRPHRRTPLPEASSTRDAGSGAGRGRRPRPTSRPS